MKNINKKVLIFIVAYNAEKTISNVISRIPLDLQKNYKTEIVLIQHITLVILVLKQNFEVI